MSNKEICVQMLDGFTESQLGALLNIIKAYKEALDEAVDNAFCEALMKDYETAPDKDEFISSDELAQQLGIA